MNGNAADPSNNPPLHLPSDLEDKVVDPMMELYIKTPKEHISRDHLGKRTWSTLSQHDAKFRRKMLRRLWITIENSKLV